MRYEGNGNNGARGETGEMDNILRRKAHVELMGASPLTNGVGSCGKCFSEPDGASPALLHATLKGRERMQLRVIYTRNVGV